MLSVVMVFLFGVAGICFGYFLGLETMRKAYGDPHCQRCGEPADELAICDKCWIEMIHDLNVSICNKKYLMNVIKEQNEKLTRINTEREGKKCIQSKLTR